MKPFWNPYQTLVKKPLVKPIQSPSTLIKPLWNPYQALTNKTLQKETFLKTHPNIPWWKTPTPHEIPARSAGSSCRSWHLWPAARSRWPSAAACGGARSRRRRRSWNSPGRSQRTFNGRTTAQRKREESAGWTGKTQGKHDDDLRFIEDLYMFDVPLLADRNFMFDTPVMKNSGPNRLNEVFQMWCGQKNMVLTSQKHLLGGSSHLVSGL